MIDMNTKTIFILFFLMIVLSLSGCTGVLQDSSSIPRTFENVTYVVDGDTFTLDSGERVRLIGMDTPEMGEDYYAEATEHLTALILNKQVELEGDVSNRDQYGRLLRYVWIDGIMVNTELVRSGLAESKSYDPDTKYQDILDEAEDGARDARLGIWSSTVRFDNIDPKDIVSYLDAMQYVGEVRTVEGRIVQTYRNEDAGIIFLNFHDPYKGYFTAVIWSDDWDRFPDDCEDYYYGKNVLVTGKIIEYNGAPEIEMSDPSQLEVQA